MTALLTAEALGSTWALRNVLSVAAEDREVRVDGASIHYRFWEGPAERRGPPVLLVHGMFAHARWWDAVAGWLQADHAVAAVDLSGMGDSDRRLRYTRQIHAQEIGAVARDAKFHRAVLIAHSYGGDPAIRCALAQPRLFRQLIVLDSRLLLPGVRAYVPGNGPAPPVRRAYPDFETALSRFRFLPPSDRPDAIMMDHIARLSVLRENDGWTWKFDKDVAMEGEVPASLDPRPLTTPVTFIRGEESNVTTPHQMNLTRTFLRNARFASLPAAGHHLMVDQPLALTAMLRGILAGA